MGALVSRKQTSQQSNCDHANIVLEWGFVDDKHNWGPSLWGCSQCDATSPTRFYDYATIEEVDHSNCESDPCFGCRAKSLQISTGDAGTVVSKKAFEGRLANYANARRQGIQPAGTNASQVEAAYKASETLGKAYDAGTMVDTAKITKRTAKLMKEIGK